MNWLFLTIFGLFITLQCIAGHEANEKRSVQFIEDAVKGIKNFFGFSEPELSKAEPGTTQEVDESYESIFGENYFDYNYPPNHTFIGENTAIYEAYLSNSKVVIENVENSTNRRFLPHALKQIPDYVELVRGKFIPALRYHVYEGVPEIVYPRLTIIVDNTLYSKFNGDVFHIVQYVIQIWMRVDLIYRQFTWPKVRLNIARIIVVKDKDAMSYFVRPPLIKKRVSTIAEFLIRSYPNIFDSHSIHIRMSTIANSTQGIAQQNSACESISPHAIIRIVGNALDVRVAAHELAHVFGAVHDKYHIMDTKPTFMNSNLFRFSYPSKENIARHFRDNQCFYSKPNVQHPIEINLPGYYVSLDKQCQLDEPILGYIIKPTIDDSKKGDAFCDRLPCDSGIDVRPLEGTICDDRGIVKICVRNRCIKPPEQLKENYQNLLKRPC